MFLDAAEGMHERLVDEFAVEIVLRLVDDERRLALGEKQNGEENRLLLAERKLGKIFDRISLAAVGEDDRLRDDDLGTILKKRTAGSPPTVPRP